jgi:plasmid stability protein
MKLNGTDRGSQEEALPVNLSIKRVPDELAERLRQLAARNHRSLQGELMAMLEQHLTTPERLTLQQVFDRVLASGLRTSSESVEMIRADRNR